MAHYDYTCVAFVNEANIGTDFFEVSDCKSQEAFADLIAQDPQGFISERGIIGTVSSIDVYRGVPTAADVLAIDCATVYADGSVEY